MKSAKAENTSRRIEELFEEAIKLRDLNRLSEAVIPLTIILSMHPGKRAPVLGTLGNVYFKLGDYQKALECFWETVTLSPKSELASLGLFHTYWELGERDKAFAEANRYLEIGTSDEYNLLFDDLSGEFLETKGPKEC